MKYYPVFLDLTKRKVVVAGGGKVAERKVRALAEAGASVKVISPSITAGLRRLKEEGKIRHLQRKFRKGDAKDAFLVIAGTSSAETNIRIAQEAECLINVIDTPSDGNFIVPSAVKRSPLHIAISTGGASPAAAKAIREELEGLYDRDFARYLRFLESIRKRALREVPDKGKRESFLKALASEAIFKKLRKKGFSAVSKEITDLLENLKTDPR